MERCLHPDCDPRYRLEKRSGAHAQEYHVHVIECRTCGHATFHAYSENTALKNHNDCMWVKREEQKKDREMV